MLLRVLPSVYPKKPDIIHRHMGSLTAMMSRLESPEQQHLIRLIQVVAEQHPLMLSPNVPTLVTYLSEHSLTEPLLGALVDVSQASPSSLVSFLPTLRTVGQQSTAFLGHVAKIHGAVGIISETHAHSALVYLVSLLDSMEHSFHHTLLLEIGALTDRYPSLLGGCGKDIYRMSNSFTVIARLLGRRLEDKMATQCRVDEACPSPSASLPTGRGGGVSETHLQVKIQSFEEKMGEEQVVLEGSPPPQRRYSLSQAVREERREMRFNRSKSLALHILRSRSINSDTGEEGDVAEASPDSCLCNALPDQSSESQEVSPAERRLTDSSRGCVAKLSFSCPLKGHYCLYAKSCFNLTSRQPHLWIHIMLLHLQSKSSVPLCTRDKCVQRLASLWERTQLKGSHSFSMAMTQHTTPHRKDLDNLQIQLEEVRFFDLFGYSEEEGCWLCFMCNNPEKATVVNQEGQPLIEGKLKEKQVRWKFIKRWKTRYFTLAGNQLLFRRGKSKDELDDIPIELSKVQSVKVVAKKRRDRGLPRAFEIFTDSKTYVLKAQDEKHAEEWLQCINVAVAQAREKENREATTYL
ncbi:unnamed protein product [Menidia menidia]|uniref:(Atlantic silverside) hypothetical protein n=1 Tax=Menidia menidia TaxID=238744 RepID=A0A8S4BQ87_9TELE|nr:unnamed protein product [Menidia menidia]